MLHYTEEYLCDLCEASTSHLDLEKLASKKVLVTGASGLICSALVDQLLIWNKMHKLDMVIYAAGRSKEKMMRRFSYWGGQDCFRFCQYDATLVSCIGNSITRCPGFLDEDRGMAASTSDKDYFHIVSTYLEDGLDEDVVSYAFNAAAWEQQANNRGEVLAMGLWDGYLSEKLDLVTIQLSENCSDTTTLEYDFREMVEYVQEKCPNAQIIIVDDFWSDEKSQIKHSAIDGLDIEWVNLSEIRGNVEYQVGMGSIVYWNSGEEYVIEHEGVASHPGDNGMMYYAQKIIEQINLDK